jgi:nitronate monooxygenase
MLRTRLTERLGLEHPIVAAPMAYVSGGKLAAAVSSGGGLGLIGAGYSDQSWLTEQFDRAGSSRVGCGFITHLLKRQEHMLDIALERAPAAIFLSFGDPAPFVDRIKLAGVPLMCQVQTVRDATHVLDLGADVVVAQGTEAGGHGQLRGTFTLVPEVADLIAVRSPATLLCAAGGIADGRGLAAALTLGADGAVIGTRLWASTEAMVHPNQLRAVVAATGDETIRNRVMDIVKGNDIWPARYTMRTLRSATTDRWHGNEEELRTHAQREQKVFAEANQRGDVSVVGATVGEAIGLIHDIEPAAEIVRRISREAEKILH